MAFALKGASPSILGHQVLTLCGDGIKLTPHLTLVASSSTLDPTLLPSTVLWFSKLLSFQVNRWPGGSGGEGGFVSRTASAFTLRADTVLHSQEADLVVLILGTTDFNSRMHNAGVKSRP